MCRRVLLVLGILAGPAAAGVRQSEQAPEYDLKAAFLYNFGTFTEWPAKAFAAPDAPFVVGVVGKDPFGAALEDTFRGQTVQKRRAEIRRSDDPAKLKGAHLLFVPATEKARFKEILEAFRGTSTLVVGESEGFAAAGGSMNLFIQSKRLAFEVNPAAAKRAGLTLSSKLLRLAWIVEEKEK
jgi:hypothetical protein